MAKICPVCNQKIGLLMKSKVSDGEICSSCASICSAHATKTLNDIHTYWNTNKERENIFSPTQKLKSLMSEVITIDSTNNLFIFGDIDKIKTKPIFYAFNEVDSYEFEIVGQKTVTKKKGGISRAIVGGVVAGPVGALVGSGTAKEETKTTGGTTILKVNFITHTGKNQRVCANAPTGFVNFLDDCITIEETVNNTTQTSISTDEIIKFKALLDQGIITQEEFNKKKKELLGL